MTMQIKPSPIRPLPRRTTSLIGPDTARLQRLAENANGLRPTQSAAEMRQRIKAGLAAAFWISHEEAPQKTRNVLALMAQKSPDALAGFVRVALSAEPASGGRLIDYCLQEELLLVESLPIELPWVIGEAHPNVSVGRTKGKVLHVDILDEEGKPETGITLRVNEAAREKPEILELDDGTLVTSDRLPGLMEFRRLLEEFQKG